MGTRAYLIGQGYSNLKRHSGKTFSTMLIICATMLILGLFIMIYINIETNAKVITENQGLKAFISDDIEESQIDEISARIKEISNVKSITYLDKDDALNDAKDTLKDYAYLLDGYEKFNPFPRSFVVVFENLESTENVKEAVESVDGIYKVSYNDTIIDAIVAISDIGNIVIIAFGVIMVCVSIFIISNTIKLAVYSNKREIYIMKYIGATPKFIRYPFVVSGVLMGIGSALFTWIISSLGYMAIYSKLPQMNSELGAFGLVAYSNFWYIVLITFLLAGIVLGGIGSRIAIKKYLKDFKPSKVVLKEEKKKVRQEKENEKEIKAQEKLKEKRTKQDEKWKEKQAELDRKREEKQKQQEEKQKEKQEKISKKAEKKNVSEEVLERRKEVIKPKNSMSELEEAKELRRAGRRNAKKK